MSFHFKKAHLLSPWQRLIKREHISIAVNFARLHIAMMSMPNINAAVDYCRFTIQPMPNKRRSYRSLYKLEYTLRNKCSIQMWEYNMRIKSDLGIQAITPLPSTILILCPRWSDDISVAPNNGGEVIIRKVTGQIHGMGDWSFPNAMPKYRQCCDVFAWKRLVYFVLLTYVTGNWKYYRHITSKLYLYDRKH